MEDGLDAREAKEMASLHCQELTTARLRRKEPKSAPFGHTKSLYLNKSGLRRTQKLDNSRPQGAKNWTSLCCGSFDLNECKT